MKRWPLFVALLVVSGPCHGWDTTPHQRITRAALNALPKHCLDRLGGEALPLVEIYCTLPDRYLEMDRSHFVRQGSGPKTAAEIEVYCVRPDGLIMHAITGDREADTASLVYLLERMASMLAGQRPGDAARFAGVLAHFIEDSLSPPHSMSAERLGELALPQAASGASLHAAIERSVPAFTLAPRPLPAMVSGQFVTAAESIAERCYLGAAENRRRLPAMVKAVCEHDEKALDVERLRAGVEAAKILADALATVLAAEER